MVGGKVASAGYPSSHVGGRGGAAVALPGVTWDYLRFVRATTVKWRPAAGTFEGWPKAAKDITVLDPCMGSGHFLVFALPILVAMRMQEEGLSLSAAVDCGA